MLEMIKHLVAIIKLIIVYSFSKIFLNKTKFKDIWIISERKSEARDNGYHLFKYIRKNYPSINIYYCINKDSIDRKKIIDYGNIINFGSIKHYFYYVNSTTHISTHIGGYMPDEKVCRHMEKLLPIKAKKVFLQHGIIQHYHEYLSKKYTRLNLFVCGAKKEYDFVKNKFGFNDEVKYLGLARYDNLFDYEAEKIILLMPTYRSWLWFNHKDTINKEQLSYFKNSEYYIRYSELLKDTRLSNILKKYGYKLIFYPHFEIQKYIYSLRDEIKLDNIIIADKINFDVQDLLKKSKVLITDYSSIHFDFAYMKKPILYYQFDYDKFLDKHYEKGYFDYIKHGFGPVINDLDNIINNLEIILMNNCKNNNTYINRIEQFFPLRDKCNCYRNFKAITNLK
ncbi:teichoic acid biosynthesis protein B [Clostridium perfringens]|nr:CDP-glycerol glycerophosphotransferase family protein [Clostridium perfringens]